MFNKEMVQAVSKGIPMSAQKLRLVIDLIRNKPAIEAVKILRFMNKKAAVFVGKTLKSVIANAENNKSWETDNLKIAAIFADEGRVAKRVHFRGRGRTARIEKKTCSVTVKLSLINEAKEK